MKNKKIVVFDLDGTLIDTLDDLMDSVNVQLEKFGYPLRSRKEIRDFVGNGNLLLMKRSFGEDAPSDVIDASYEGFKAYYKDHCMDKTKPYDGILDVLKAVKEKGYKTAIVSNKVDFATKQLSKQWFGNLIDYAQGQEDNLLMKPAPDAIYKVLNILGEKLEDAVYVGDSNVDVQTAKNANMDMITVTYGFRDEDVLIKLGAQNFAHTPQEILNYL